MAAGGDLFGAMFDRVDSLTSSFVSSVYSAMTPEVSALLSTMYIVYIAYWGYQMIYGRSTMMIGDIAERIIRMTMIFLFISSWPLFQTFVVDIANKMPDRIGTLLMTAFGQGKAGGINNIQQALSEIFAAGADTARVLWSKGALWSFGLAVMGAVFFIIIGIFCAIAAAYILLAKLGVAIILGLGPLYIIMALFPQTRGFTEKWIGQLIYFMVVQILTYTALAFMLSLISNSIDALSAANVDASTTMSTVGPVLIYALVGILLVPQMQIVASGLVGTIGTDLTAGGRLTPGFWMKNAGKGVRKGAKFALGRGRSKGE